ncbi:hypothetical protein D3C73_1513630 [compost metagenome]
MSPADFVLNAQLLHRLHPAFNSLYMAELLFQARHNLIRTVALGMRFQVNQNTPIAEFRVIGINADK